MAGPTSSDLPLSAAAADPTWRWRSVDPRYAALLAPVVDALLCGDREPERASPVSILRDKPGRRRLAQARLTSGERVFAKHFAARDPLWKRSLGLTPAARELRAARALERSGVSVAEPLAHAQSASGEEVLVTRFLPGESLESALQRPRAQRRALLARVGALVHRLHASGRVHRDLHRENLWITDAGPVLVDLQQVLPIAPRRLVLRDLGELDASLAPLLSLSERLRLRAALLGAERPFDAGTRAALRAVGRASEARYRAHVESRTRRCLAPGRLYERFHCELGSGMRLREVSEVALAAALTSAAPSSDARGAWMAGHGLRARGIGAPRPQGFVEGAGSGRVALAPGSDHPPARPDEIVALGVALRRHRVVIAPESRLSRDAEGRLGPLPLEGVSFPRDLDAFQARRIDDRVERELARVLGPDAAGREAAMDRYRRRLRFYDADTVTQRK